MTTVPQDFYCPISSTVMIDPVYPEGHEGHNFERIQIEHWLWMGKKTCPLDNLDISECRLNANENLSKRIKAWARSNPEISGMEIDLLDHEGMLEKFFKMRVKRELELSYPAYRKVTTSTGKAKMKFLKGTQIASAVAFGILIVGSHGSLAAPVVIGKLVGASIGTFIVSTTCRYNKSVREILRIEKTHKPRQMPRHLLHRLGVCKTRNKSRKIVKALKRVGLVTMKKRLIRIRGVADVELSRRMDIVQERCNLDDRQVLKIVATLKIVGEEGVFHLEGD